MYSSNYLFLKALEKNSLKVGKVLFLYFKKVLFSSFDIHIYAIGTIFSLMILTFVKLLVVRSIVFDVISIAHYARVSNFIMHFIITFAKILNDT